MKGKREEEKNRRVKGKREEKRGERGGEAETTSPFVLAQKRG